MRNFNVHYYSPSIDTTVNEDQNNVSDLLLYVASVVEDLLLNDCDFRIEEGTDIVTLQMKLSIKKTKNEDPIEIVFE
jgi:hypothetical protein